MNNDTVFFQMLAERQNRWMLDDGRDDLVTLRLRPQCRKNRCRIGFRAAGGKDDFRIELGADQRLHGTARRLEALRHLVAETVHRRGIAELLGKVRQHGFNDRRITGRRRIVVEIDRVHGSHLRAWASKAAGKSWTNSPSASTSCAWMPESVACSIMQPWHAPFRLT